MTGSKAIASKNEGDKWTISFQFCNCSSPSGAWTIITALTYTIAFVSLAAKFPLKLYPHGAVCYPPRYSLPFSFSLSGTDKRLLYLYQKSHINVTRVQLGKVRSTHRQFPTLMASQRRSVSIPAGALWKAGRQWRYALKLTFVPQIGQCCKGCSISCAILAATEIALLKRETKNSILRWEGTPQGPETRWITSPPGFWCHKVWCSPAARGSLFPSPSPGVLKVLHPLTIDEGKEDAFDTYSSCQVSLSSDRQIVIALNNFRERNSIFLNCMLTYWHLTDTSLPLEVNGAPRIWCHCSTCLCRSTSKGGQTSSTCLIGMDALGTSEHEKRRKRIDYCELWINTDVVVRIHDCWGS